MSLHTKIKLIIILIILLAFFTKTKAQENKYNEVVKIVGDYTPTINDAFKINLTPKIKDTTIAPPKLNYKIDSKKINTAFEVEEIKPAKLIGEPLNKLYNSMFSGGFGNYVTPYAEYDFNSLRARDFSAGFHLYHLSSNDNEGIKNYYNSKYSDNAAEVYGKYELQNYDVYGDISYKRNVVHYYGRSLPANSLPSHTIDSINDLAKNADLRQRFSCIGFNAGITSNNTNPNYISHSLDIKYYNLTDLFSTSENNYYVKASGSYNLNFWHAARSQKVVLDADMDIYDDKDTLLKKTVKFDDAVFRVMPQLYTDLDMLKINLGVNISSITDGKGSTNLYPVVDLNLKLIDEILYAFGGITGGIERNSFREFTDENPFVISSVSYQYSNNKIEFYGGIKGNVTSFVNYDLSVSESTTDNLPLFVNDTNRKANNNNKFMVIYDDATILHLKGELTFQESKKLDFILRGDYYNYTMKNELKAWERPGYDLSLTGNYNLTDKITLRANLTGLFELYAKSYLQTISNNIEITTPHSTKLNNIYDINLGVDYKINKQFSAFINLNDIGNYSYYRWYNYPSERFNFIVGVRVSF